MAWYVYSPEDFPSKKSGRPYELIEVAGQRISLKAKSWTKLQTRYETFRHEDWQDTVGHQYPVFADEVATAINDQYGYRGVFATESAPDSEEAKRLIADAEARNLAWRRKVVENFERNLATVRMGRPGRTDLTLYEKECYEVLGLPAPASIEEYRQKMQPQAAPTINITLTPDLIKQIRAMPESQVEQMAADLPKTNPTPQPVAPKSLEEAKRVVKGAEKGL